MIITLSIKQKIDLIIHEIYNNVVNTNNKTYNYPVPTHKDSKFSDPFYINNMNEIIDGLQILLPDSLITHAIVAHGTDGNIYDISKIDDNILPFIVSTCYNSYIIVNKK